jgi:hypothetical protein
MELKFNLDICLEGLNQTTKYLSQDRECPDRDSSRAPSEYKTRALQLHDLLYFSVPV